MYIFGGNYRNTFFNDVFTFSAGALAAILMDVASKMNVSNAVVSLSYE
jgi:hypothetical protein